jgi:hypothetical protein
VWSASYENTTTDRPTDRRGVRVSPAVVLGDSIVVRVEVSVRPVQTMAQLRVSITVTNLSAGGSRNARGYRS